MQAVTARYALERGIEARFQLEDSELMSEQLPDAEERGRLLLTEAAEGGAGVLRRLQSDATALSDAARESLRIIHVDPDTARPRRCVRSWVLPMPAVYSNQMDHEQIDRRVVGALLLQLSRAAIRPEEATPVAPPTAPSGSDCPIGSPPSGSRG